MRESLEFERGVGNPEGEWLSQVDAESTLKSALEDLRDNFEGDPFKFEDNKNPEEIERIKNAATTWLEKYKGSDSHVDNAATLLSGLNVRKEEGEEKEAA